MSLSFVQPPLPKKNYWPVKFVQIDQKEWNLMLMPRFGLSGQMK